MSLQEFMIGPMMVLLFLEKTWWTPFVIWERPCEALRTFIAAITKWAVTAAPQMARSQRCVWITRLYLKRVESVAAATAAATTTGATGKAARVATSIGLEVQREETEAGPEGKMSW